MMELSSGQVFQEIGEPVQRGSGGRSHLRAPENKQRRSSLVLLAAPYIDPIKKNIERRKSEISLHLPQIPLLTQRRKSEVNIQQPLPIPHITVTDDQVDVEYQGELTTPSTSDNVIDFEGREIFEEDVEQPEEEEGMYNKCLSIFVIIVVFFWKILKTPWRMWRKAKFMPTEEEITQLIMSGETPDKFSRIDIAARKYFPIAFCLLMLSYWIAYVYYITDEFPAKDVNPLLLKSKCHA